MPPRSVRVRTPSRLHFGLLSFGQPAEREFGGIGAMIDRPGIELELRSAAEFSSHGLLAERVSETAKRISRRLELASPPACRIEVRAASAEHRGLGTGTQLAMAVAAALLEWCETPLPAPPDLARLAGRGLRSAIGLYGFSEGGLLYEAGKLPAEDISPLIARSEIPKSWRFVLLVPQEEPGLSGAAERDAFADLPAVSPERTQRMRDEIEQHILPAAGSGDFAEFSQAVYRYGILAGECFASRQGGPFASPGIAAWAEWLRSQGVAGVGQSSWGPTLFALQPSQSAAESLVAGIRGRAPEIEAWIAAPQNRGAEIAVEVAD